MSVSLIIGAQWGDEGKGKIIDYLSREADFVVRYHGGNNAGHTIINEYGKFAMHLVPSGIFCNKTVGVIANGTVIDLEVLLSEIEALKKAGVEMKNRLYISPRCHLIMPYHKILEGMSEEAKGKGKTGTTGRGIGPVHADKVSYNGIRIFDLMDKPRFSEKLRAQLKLKNKIIQAFGQKGLSQTDIEKEFFSYWEKIKQYVFEPYKILQNAIKQKKNILLEGAQGMFLDNDWGTYPFVTASTVVSGGITHGSAIAPRHLTNVVGVVKAYTTRVGQGPFPTELMDKNGELIREKGGEFGATTGRVRRCGWFDAELVSFAAEINGFTEIAVTKLDILDGFSQLQICTGYTLNGNPIRYWEIDAETLENIIPVYKTVKGWSKPTAGVKKYDQLPKEAKEYLSEIEKLVGVKISYISTGGERDAIIKR